jgi:hypothetical protein
VAQPYVARRFRYSDAILGDSILAELLVLLSPWLALACLIIWDARNQPREVAPEFEAKPVSADFAALISEEQREDREKKIREWITIVLIAMTFVAVCYQVREMIKVYEPIKEQAEATKQAADASTRAADAATRQSEIATGQSEKSERALVLAQRAWVGPTIARVVGTPEIGKPLKINIQYANSGREPALNFIYAADVLAATAADEANGVLTAKVNAAFRGCKEATTLRAGQVVFPTVANTANTLSVTTNDKFVDQAIIDGETTIVIDGCLVYKSFDVIRVTMRGRPQAR